MVRRRKGEFAGNLERLNRSMIPGMSTLIGMFIFEFDPSTILITSLIVTGIFYFAIGK